VTINATTRLLDEGGRAMESEPDLEVARSAIPGQIKTVEGVLVSAPRNRTLLAMAARACLEFAFGFLEDDVEALSGKREAAEKRAASARATAMYDRAVEHSLRLLATFNPEIRAAYAEGGAAWEQAVAELPADSLPGLTFGGMALASSVALNRADPERLADLPRARVMLERSRALDRRFHRGGATMVLGIICAQLGDRPCAQRLLDEAVAIAGEAYLLPRVVAARLLLEGRERVRALEAVLAVPPGAHPDTRLANEVARRRAARDLVGLKPGRR
jgi:hypothetical protein